MILQLCKISSSSGFSSLFSQEVNPNEIQIQASVRLRRILRAIQLLVVFIMVFAFIALCFEFYTDYYFSPRYCRVPGIRPWPFCVNKVTVTTAATLPPKGGFY